MARPADPLLRATARFVAVAFALTGVAVLWQDAIVNGVLPLFRLWLDLIDDSYRTIDLAVVEAHGESVVRRLATPGFLQVVGGTMVYPDGALQFSNQASAGMVLQAPILAMALLAGWPWKSRRELAFRLAAAMPFLMLVLVLDVPTMLYGFAWLDTLTAFHVDGFSFLVSWADVMNAGGRFVLALLAVFFPVWLGAHSSSVPVRRVRPPAPGAADPAGAAAWSDSAQRP